MHTPNYSGHNVVFENKETAAILAFQTKQTKLTFSFVSVNQYGG